MGHDLDETHRWRERTEVLVCIDCRVEGYDDEPAAFSPCLKAPRMKACLVTMSSRDDPGHTHRCIGGHSGENHFCRDCDRWFGVSS